MADLENAVISVWEYRTDDIPSVGLVKLWNPWARLAIMTNRRCPAWSDLQPAGSEVASLYMMRYINAFEAGWDECPEVASAWLACGARLLLIDSALE
jgi:hypothetical protein